MASYIPIQYEYFFNKSFWPIHDKLTGTITLNLSVPGSNGNEGIDQFHSP